MTETINISIVQDTSIIEVSVAEVIGDVQTLNLNVIESDETINIEVSEVGRKGDKGDPGSNTLGFINYDVPGPFSLSAGVRTFIDLSGATLGFATSDAALTAHPFFNPDGTFDPFGITLGSEYRMRMNLFLTSFVVDNTIRMELDIGPPFEVIETASEDLFYDAGVQEVISPLFDFFSAAAFKANRGSFYAIANADCVIDRIQIRLKVEAIGEIDP